MATFVLTLRAPRPTFALDMSEEERRIMGRHAAYWKPVVDAGRMVVFGPVLDGSGSWGLGVRTPAETPRARGRDSRVELTPTSQFVGSVRRVIEARGLTKRYPTALAVDDLSFSVHPGHVTGFLGPNGAGKSTTMRLILGLDRPTAGTVTVDGKAYADHRYPLHEVGALLDAGAVHPGRRARDHLWCLAQSNRIGRARVDEVLEAVGLTTVAGQRIGTFSLGMRQRLGMAAALLGDPPVLMFDEPVNGLDPEGILWIRTLFRALAAEGRTVFVSSHLMSEMSLTADHVIVIGRGRLIADSPMSALLVRGTSRVSVRSPDAPRLAALVTAAGGHVEDQRDDEFVVVDFPAARVGEVAAADGIVLHALTTEQASLEETYFELTNDSVDFHGDVVGTGGAR